MRTTIFALGAAAALTFSAIALAALPAGAAEATPGDMPGMMGTMPMTGTMPGGAPGMTGAMPMTGTMPGGMPGMMGMMPMMMGMMPMMQGMPGMTGMQGMQGMGLPSGDDGPSSLAFQGANNKMHRDMAIAYSGKVEVDFVKGMIPHHQGAIDMAKIELAFGSDPEIRKLAEAVIKAQEAEIAMMREWLKKNGE